MKNDFGRPLFEFRRPAEPLPPEATLAAVLAIFVEGFRTALRAPRIARMLGAVGATPDAAALLASAAAVADHAARYLTERDRLIDGFWWRALRPEHVKNAPPSPAQAAGALRALRDAAAQFHCALDELIDGGLAGSETRDAAAAALLAGTASSDLANGAIVAGAPAP